MVNKGSFSQETVVKALDFLKFGLYLKFKTIGTTHGYKFLESRGKTGDKQWSQEYVIAIHILIENAKLIVL